MLAEAIPQALETPGEIDSSGGSQGGAGTTAGADTASWSERYEQHFDFAWRTARRLGVRESDVEDVVHEAFEIAFRKASEFDHGLFSTWLYRIVANVALGKVRRGRVREVLHSLWGDDEEPRTASPEAMVDARRTLGAVEGVLRALPAKKREVFALHELEGLTHEEIAELVGCKVETVRTRLHYAKQDFEKLARKKGLMP